MMLTCMFADSSGIKSTCGKSRSSCSSCSVAQAKWFLWLLCKVRDKKHNSADDVDAQSVAPNSVVLATDTELRASIMACKPIRTRIALCSLLIT